MAKTKRPVGRQPPGGASKNEGQEPVGPANEYLIISWSFIAMAGICLDRLLKQRSALRRPGNPFDFPPRLRGGLRSLSVAAVCLAAEIASFLRTFIQSPTNS
jgi:hypothetical protein